MSDRDDERGSKPPAKLLERRGIYQGRVVDLAIDRVELTNGETVELEVIRHCGAAAVVPIDEREDVVLVRQYRWATGRWLLEVPAGKLDDGEKPVSCAARELEEETGFRAGRIDPLGPLWTTPGFTDERIWVFLARDLLSVGQNLEPDEMLTVVKMPLAEAVDRAARGEIEDGKTICALFRARDYLDRERDDARNGETER